MVAQKITTYPCIQHSRGEPVGTSQIMFSTGRTTRRTMGMPCAEESMMIIYMLSCFDTISERDRRTDRLAIARQHIVVLTRDKNRCGIRVHQCHQMNYVLYDDVVLWLRRNCLYYSLKTFNFLVVKLSKFSRFCWWGTNDNSRHTIIVCGLVKKRKENAWRVSWIENMIFWCWTLLQPLMCTVRGVGAATCMCSRLNDVGRLQVCDTVHAVST